MRGDDEKERWGLAVQELSYTVTNCAVWWINKDVMDLV